MHHPNRIISVQAQRHTPRQAALPQVPFPGGEAAALAWRVAVHGPPSPRLCTAWPGPPAGRPPPQDKIDAARAAVDDARHGTRLPRQMERQVKVVQVRKHLHCHLADGRLGHLCLRGRVREGELGPARRVNARRQVPVMPVPAGGPTRLRFGGNAEATAHPCNCRACLPCLAAAALRHRFATRAAHRGQVKGHPRHANPPNQPATTKGLP